MSVGRLIAKFAKSLDTNGIHSGAHEIGDLKWSARATPSAKWLTCDGAAYSRSTYVALFSAIGTSFGGGDGSTTFNVPDYRGRAPVGAGTGTLAEAVAASAVTIAADTIAVASNADRWITGMAVTVATSGTIPPPLVAGTTYYVIRVDAVTIKLATTLANAVAGTTIDITSQGVGIHTIAHALTARARGDKVGEERHALTTAELAAHTHPIDSNNSRNTVSGGSDTVAMGGGAILNTNSTGGSGAHNNMQPSTVSNVFIFAGV